MDWQDVARQVAPTLAAGLLGPLGGVVAKVAAGALLPDSPEAREKATPRAIIERIAGIASTDDVAKLKRAELEVQKFEAETKIRLADLEPRGDEGARTVRGAAFASGNRTADQLARIVIVSFLVVAALVLVGCGLAVSGVVQVTDENRGVWIAISGLVGAIVGYFSANAQQVIGFYFGSSAGSAAKTDQLASATAGAIAAIGGARARGPEPEPTVTRTEVPGGPTTITGVGQGAVEEVVDGTSPPRPAPGRGAAPAVPVPSGPAPSANWDACVAYVLECEGGFVADHDDPGGPTNMGITQRTLADWRGEDVAADDVEGLAADEARAIYRAKYWNTARCDALPAGVDLMVFEAAVMSGPGQAARFLQRAAGMPDSEVDGVVGPRTLDAARRASPVQLIEEMRRQRGAFFERIVARKPTSAKFLKGWTSRLDRTFERAVSMARRAA